MNKTKSNDIQYRRGIVLGLTFAELLILLLFVVMLVLGSTIKKSKDTNSKQYSESELTEMSSLSALFKDKDLKSYREASKLLNDGENEKAFEKLTGRPPNSMKGNEVLPETEISEIGGVVALIKTKNAGSYHKLQQHLKSGEIEKAYQLIVESSPVYKNITNEIQTTQNMISDCKAQNKHLVQLKNVGGPGGDFPSCWFDENGGKQFIYHVDLTDLGIIVHDIVIPARVHDKMNLPLKDFKIDSIMQPAEFIKAGQKIKKYSDDNSCRFFVKISDKTSPNSKEHYKKLRNTVENIFYKKDI